MFDLILSLLGKSIDGPQYRQLLQEVGTPSSVYDVPITEKSTLRMMEFYQLGFGIAYSLQADLFRIIGIEYSPLSKIRPMQPFPEPGPAGIDHRDSKRAVQKKMALLPISSRKLKTYMRVTYKTGATPDSVSVRWKRASALRIHRCINRAVESEQC